MRIERIEPKAAAVKCDDCHRNAVVLIMIAKLLDVRLCARCSHYLSGFLRDRLSEWGLE